MKYLVSCLLMFCAQASFAQFFKIDYITSKDSAEKTFLHIESTQRPLIAKKIYAFVSQEWGYNPDAKDPFANLSIMEEASFDFNVGANNDRVLSMIVESSYSACGLHIDRHAYHFDSKTGVPIDQNKLFGADGQAKLKKALHKSWKAALKVASEDKSDSRSDEYKACLANDTETETTPDRMIITDQGIQFWAGYCLEGTAYDFEADRGQGPHTYSLGQLLPMLTQYGFTLFVDNPAAPLQTLLRGTIDGKYPISLTLFAGKDAASIVGMIVYDRVGEPINVNGAMNGSEITLHELDAAGTTLSDIKVTWNGTKLAGSFINLRSKKLMPFEASIVK